VPPCIRLAPSGESYGSNRRPGEWLKVTCGLTACPPASTSGPTLGNEYRRTLPFSLAPGLAEPQKFTLWENKNSALFSTHTINRLPVYFSRPYCSHVTYLSKFAQTSCVRKAGIPWDRQRHRHRYGHPHRLPREPDTHDDTRRFVRRLARHARFSSRGCPLVMRGCTRVNVYCTRYAIVYTFTKLHDRCIPKVGVGVSPMEFQLN